MKKLLLFLLLSPFALFANEAIVSDEVLKTMEKHFGSEVPEDLNQTFNPTGGCVQASATLSCYGSCSGGSTHIATLPEANAGNAYSQLIGIANSLCGSCGYSLSSIGENQVPCIDFTLKLLICTA